MKTKVLVEGAVMIALAVVLDFVFKAIPLFKMPQGGSVSLVMLPIIIYAVRHGVKQGVIAGMILGYIAFLIDGYGLHWGSLFLDYFFAFGVLGLAGIYGKDNLQKFVLATVTVGFFRFLLHVASGVLFFASYAPEGMTPIWYSISYNGPYMIGSTILCAIVGGVVYKRVKHL